MNKEPIVRLAEPADQSQCAEIFFEARRQAFDWVEPERPVENLAMASKRSVKYAH